MSTETSDKLKFFSPDIQLLIADFVYLILVTFLWMLFGPLFATEANIVPRSDQTKTVIGATVLLLAAATLTVLMLRILSQNRIDLEQAAPGVIHNVHIRELLATVVGALAAELVAGPTVFAVLNWVAIIFTLIPMLMLIYKKYSEYNGSSASADQGNRAHDEDE